MAKITAGADSNERPPEGTFPFYIISIKHVTGQYGPQIELVGRLTTPEGPRTIKKWIGMKEGTLPKDHVIAKLAGVVLFGKPTVDKGDEFDDEDERFSGATVKATIRHYEKGPKSKTPGAPDWAFDDFQAHVVTISAEVAEGIRASLRTLFAAEAALGIEALKAAVAELVVDTIGVNKMVTEFTPEEAAQVKATIKATAKAKKISLDAPVTEPETVAA